ncbi:MAG: Ig-like domain-containing protein [Deltaproteobacteria bacterium]|nr:Ig-like domain-containing protein [Deltaproteobacteria bacterium]
MRPLTLVVCALAIAPSTAQAALSGFGPTSLAHGFPLWYADAAGFKVAPCLEAKVLDVGGQLMKPCMTLEPVPGSPLSFPQNFGVEEMYWSADALAVFSSTQGGLPFGAPGDVTVSMALVASFPALVVAEGQQVVFARLRVRANVPMTGTYRITHPFGPMDYAVSGVGGGREINHNQEIGNFVSPGRTGDYSLALLDGPAPPLPGEVGPPPKVDVLDRSIGPFLLPAATPPFLEALNGDLYLAIPQTIVNGLVVPLEQPITGSPVGQNFVRLELLNPPLGFALNGAAGTNVVETTGFSVSGKVFRDDPAPQPPVANPDRGGTTIGVAVDIDVLANDTDPGSLHFIDPQGLGLGAAPPYAIAATTPHGTVVRRTATATGRSSFVYTPAPGFTGTDSFSYVVQDTGGLISAPATVSVIVEDLKIVRAALRLRHLRFAVSGTTSEPFGPDLAPNVIRVHAGPDATGALLAQATVAADGSWACAGAFEVKQSWRSVTVVSANSTAIKNVPLSLR